MLELLKKNGPTLSMAMLVLIGLMLATGPALAGDKEDFDITAIYASHGDAKAQFRLGRMYATGTGTNQDLPQAASWYKKAAEQGDMESQYQLATMYDTGKGIPQNFTEALFWYDKATEQEHPTAKLNSDKIRNDIAVLQISAEQGKAEDQFTLGKMYTNGNGVPHDDKLAAEWYKKAAEQGHAGAQCSFGFSYAEGKGVPKDYNEAIAWYRKAAEKGEAEAQYKLGNMYHTGRGVPQSGIDAYAWLSLAASQGYDIAVKNKSFARSLLTPEQQTQAQALAAELQAMIDSKKP